MSSSTTKNRTPPSLDRAGTADWLSQEAFEKHLAYWRRQLFALPPMMELPTDRLRAPAGEFRAARYAFDLDPLTVAGFRRISQAEGVTFWAALLAVFQTLLLRYTRQDDVLLGSLGTGTVTRRESGTPNMVALRTSLAGDPSFRDLLRRTQETVTAASGHEEVPFAYLMAELQPGRDLRTSPLFRAFFSMDAALAEGENATSGAAAANFDLHLDLQPADDAMNGIFIYNAELFDLATIVRMAGHFQTLAQGALDYPEQRISRLPLLTPPEIHQLAEWNRTAADFPSGKCVHELISEQARRTPGAIAIIQGARQLTFAELDARSNQLAHYLRKLGIGLEAPVAICLDSSPELLIALLAAMKAGGACLPLDPNYPDERLCYMLEDSRAPVLLTEEKQRPRFAHTATPVTCLNAACWEAIGRESTEAPATGIQPANLAYIIYTSGSTGKPKGVLLTHRGFVNHHTAMIKLFELQPSDRVLQFSSISFDIAVEEIFPTWMAGAAVVLRTPDLALDIPTFTRWIRDQRITFLDLPTAYWHEWVHHLAERPEPPPQTLRLVVVGGEKALAPAYAVWQRVAGNRVRWVNTYGPTEASIVATFYEPDSGQPLDVSVELPIGRPIANYRIHILDASLQSLPVGVPGEVHIGGPGVARGYLNRPELSAEKFIADPFSTVPGAMLYKTGDLARYQPDGQIEFRGRGDDQVKIRGFRVELGEIEAVFAKHRAVREVAVVPNQNGAGDKRLVAYFVAVKPPGPAVSELRTFLKSKLPDYMVPSAFVALPAMPMTPNGKIDRRSLAASEPADAAPDDEYLAPRNDLEASLVKMWEGILPLRPIGVRHNFFEVGGHSLLAVRMMARIEQTFHKKLPLTTLLQAPTIEKLAALLQQESWAPSWSSLVAIQPQGSRPPLFLVHGIGGAVIGFRDLARSLGADQPVYGLQAQGLDGKHTPLNRVQDMAALYVKEIRGLQAAGPYYLGGLSLGGAVALEMAMQLRAQNQEVGLVVLFDTFPGKTATNSSLLAKLMRLPARQQAEYISKKLLTYWNTLGRRFYRLWLPDEVKRVQNANGQAALAYTTPVYHGRVTLFRPFEWSLRSVDDAQAGWGEWAAGGIEIIDVPGGHVSMLVEPNVRLVAEKLRDCLDNAIADVPAGSHR